MVEVGHDRKTNAKRFLKLDKNRLKLFVRLYVWFDLSESRLPDLPDAAG